MSKKRKGPDDLENREDEDQALDDSDEEVEVSSEELEEPDEDVEQDEDEEEDEEEEEEEQEGWRDEEMGERPSVLERLTVPAGWLGVACLVVAGTMYATKGVANWWVKGFLIAAVLLVAQFVALRWQEVRRSAGLRSTRMGASSAVTALLVVGILVSVNYIASRHSARVDLTEKKRFSLSEQTTSILKDLNKDVKMAAIAGLDDRSYGRLQDLLKQYGHASSHIKWEMLDPDADRAGIEPYLDMNPTIGSTIVASGNRRELAYIPEEENLTSAILKVTTDKKKKVYFLKGHGEKAVDQYDDQGISQAKQRLEKEQFEVEDLVLAGKNDVPDDADVLVIAGAQREPLPAEIEAIGMYLDGGGALMAMLEPPPAPSLADTLSKYSVKVNDDLVRDIQVYRTETEPIVAQYARHKITEMPGLLALVRARSLDTDNPMPPQQQPGMPPQPPPGPLAVSLGQSSPAAQSLPVKEGGGFPESGEAKQLTLAIAVSEEEPPKPPGMPDMPEEDGGLQKKARLVVVGDSDFATNEFFRQSRLFNADFFLNSIAWLAQEEKLVAIRPKAPDDRQITLTKNQKAFVFIVSIILVPLAVLASGIVVWWKRRG